MMTFIWVCLILVTAVDCRSPVPCIPRSIYSGSARRTRCDWCHAYFSNRSVISHLRYRIFHGSHLADCDYVIHWNRIIL